MSSGLPSSAVSDDTEELEAHMVICGGASTQFSVHSLRGSSVPGLGDTWVGESGQLCPQELRALQGHGQGKPQETMKLTPEQSAGIRLS